MIINSTSDWLVLIRIPGIGSVNLRQWLSIAGSARAILEAAPSDLRAQGISEKAIAYLQAPPWDDIEKDMRWLEKSGRYLLTWDDEQYPALLREINNPPLVLFVEGDINAINKAQIALVGSRHATPSGNETAYQFAEFLARAGLVITSGLAIGIDAASHRGALAANAQTIAVAGTGLAKTYPASHRKLAEQIIESGVLISEFTPFTGAVAHHFPQRNRIISGLSLGVVVVEAAIRSGSLLTARYATEQGREVFAIPGSIHNPLSRGCHYLIRNGAKLVETGADILEELGPLYAASQAHIEQGKLAEKTVKLADDHQQLLYCIDEHATPLDVILSRSRLTIAEVSSMLLQLELQNYVQPVAGGYARVR